MFTHLFRSRKATAKPVIELSVEIADRASLLDAFAQAHALAQRLGLHTVRFRFNGLEALVTQTGLGQVYRLGRLGTVAWWFAATPSTLHVPDPSYGWLGESHQGQVEAIQQ